MRHSIFSNSDGRWKKVAANFLPTSIHFFISLLLALKIVPNIALNKPIFVGRKKRNNQQIKIGMMKVMNECSLFANKFAKNLAKKFAKNKVTLLACLLVLFLLTLVGCKSSKVVENTDTHVAKVEKQEQKQSVSVKDSVQTNEVVAKADSSRVGEQTKDSIHEQTSEYVHELLELDGNGKVLKHSIDRQTTRNTDKFTINSTTKNNKSVSHNKQNNNKVSVSALNMDSLLAKVDSMSTNSKIVHQQKPKYHFVWSVENVLMIIFYVIVIAWLAPDIVRIIKKIMARMKKK